jgi:hypothetical protein
MKNFEFRLSSTLRYYELQLELEKAKLSRALAEQRQLVDAIARHIDEQRQQNDAVRKLLEMRSSELRFLSSYNLSAQSQHLILHDKLARMRRVVELQRQVVIRAERKTKLLLKLQERKQRDWQLNVSRRTEAESQEIWLATNTNKKLC